MQESKILSLFAYMQVKKGYVGIHSSGFKDFLLKPELLRAIQDCGFEHPSEGKTNLCFEPLVACARSLLFFILISQFYLKSIPSSFVGFPPFAVQHECIPQAILGMDVICQAKSGMGKTAVFVISSLQQLEPVDGQVSVVILCHTRELAFQICHEYERFTTYMKNVRVGNFFGGLPIKQQREMCKDPAKCPHIVVGTPGRVKALAEEKAMDLSHVRHFVVDECDKCLESIDMRADVQAIFKKTPHDKQVMMFSATLSSDVRPVVKKFMRDVSYLHRHYHCPSASSFATYHRVSKPTSKSHHAIIRWSNLTDTWGALLTATAAAA